MNDAYSRSIEETAAALGTDLEAGLSVHEAAARLARYGANELPAEPPVPAWRRLLAQFQDVLVLLLVVATAISLATWIYEGAHGLPYEAMVVFAVVVLNAVLGFIQESRAEAAVAALREMAAAAATVIRGGERLRLPAAQLVPGDLILVEEGDTIPADARLIESASLQTAEAALTGESMPVPKDTAPLPAGSALGDRSNMLFSGTAITYGHGRAIVTATGARTEMGRIAGLLEQTAPESTPLQWELDRTGRILGAIVVIIAAVMVGTIILVEHVSSFDAITDVLILGVALAVAAVPEGLPAVVTAVLSIGVTRMARRNAIVRRLPAVETLGSATVIASDKTGTLTRNEMTVTTVVTAGGRVRLEGTGYAPRGSIVWPAGREADDALRFELEAVLGAGNRANNAALLERGGEWTVQGDPTEGALLVAALKAGLDPTHLEERLARVGEVPFSSERKLMSTVHSDRDREGQAVIVSKGAPDVLLARCTAELVGRSRRPLTDERRREIAAMNDQLAGEALRTLALAARSIPHLTLAARREPHDQLTPEDIDEQLEEGLVFLGLVGILDPPRLEARDSIARARQAGIRPLMITGDHPRTAAVIARELGLTNGGPADAHEGFGPVVTGPELEAMDDAQLERAVARASVYARVNPEHKLRIVRALQRRGAVVAMTGDGVNDSPALKAAQIGVAMGITGTDVAKQSADMILADDNFATIVAAVEEGRGIFANIRKFLRFLLSSNIGEVMTMFFGVLLAGYIGLQPDESGVVLPLLATQILWINLVTDGLPALALGVDPASRDVMAQPPRPVGEGVITAVMWRGIFFVGAIMAAGTLLLFDAHLPGGLIEGSDDFVHARTMAFTTLMLFQLFNTFNARSDTESALPGLFRNRWLWGAITLTLLLQALVLYTPVLQRAFTTVPLTLSDWLLCAAVASSVLWVRETDKLLRRTFFRRRRP